MVWHFLVWRYIKQLMTNWQQNIYSLCKFNRKDTRITWNTKFTLWREGPLFSNLRVFYWMNVTVWRFISKHGIMHNTKQGLRINFYLLWTFCPHLGIFFFCVLFLLSLRFDQISLLAFFRWFLPWPRGPWHSG